MLDSDRMRPTLAALLGAACWVVPQAARAALPTPAVENAAGSGSAYVGTVNPNASPPLMLPAIDMGPVNITTTNNQDGSVDINLEGGIFDVVHFGPGLNQAFTGSAGVDAFLHAEIGSIHLAAIGSADTTPFAYEAPFPGALGQNPFYAQALVGIGAGFVDVVTVPATVAAPKPGDLTTVQLEALATCPPLGLSVSDGSSDFTGFVSADLSLADGTDLGGVFTMDPVIFSPSDPVCPFGASRMLANVPVLTPIVLRFNFSAQLSLTAGHGLAGVGRQGILGLAHAGDFPTDDAAIDALNTGEVMLTNSEGKGAIGSTGHDYTTLNGGPTITTTTTTTTTSTFVPPTTLPGCSGYCGDGVVQPACAETCECPMVGGMTVAVCDATTSTPPLEPACARCGGCMVDLSQCPTTTTSTSTTEPGQSTTEPGQTTTTSTTLPCRTVRCLLDDGLHACAGETIPATITKSFDRVTSLVAKAGGASSKRAKRLIKHAEHALTQAENGAKKATKGKKPKLTVGCAGAIRQAAEGVRSSLTK
jgi:hypothetical protein